MDIIRNSSLFKNLIDSDYEYAKEFFNCRKRTFEKGEIIKMTGAPIKYFALVLSGNIQVCIDEIDGQQMIFANVNPGDTFGESLCFLGLESAVYIQASVDSSLLLMDTLRIQTMSKFTDHRDVILSNRFTAMLAGRTLSMNNRIQILSKLTIRDKLITYFNQCIIDFGALEFTVPFDRATMAKYLGADRSALSRELSKMQSEGIISFDKNRFIVHSADTRSE